MKSYIGAVFVVRILPYHFYRIKNRYFDGQIYNYPNKSNIFARLKIEQVRVLAILPQQIEMRTLLKDMSISND